MRTVQGITTCALLVMCQLLLFGCGSKTDENKPIAEVKAEAEKMDASKLRAMAEAYKNAIVAKKADIEKVTAKLKDVPATELLSQEAKNLKADIENFNKSVSALKERFEVYYQKLKEKGGDVSGLEL
jgi:predicted  nucleic acid-binding Zn-ribbon protein